MYKSCIFTVVLPNHFLAPSTKRADMSAADARQHNQYRRKHRCGVVTVASVNGWFVSQWLCKSRAWCEHHETHQTNAPNISHNERMHFRLFSPDPMGCFTNIRIQQGNFVSRGIKRPVLQTVESLVAPVRPINPTALGFLPIASNRFKK